MFTASIVSYLLHEIHRLPDRLIYGLVTMLVFGEAALFIGFVLPGETAVLVAGVVASQGHVNIVRRLRPSSSSPPSPVTPSATSLAIATASQLMKLPILRRRRASLWTAPSKDYDVADRSTSSSVASPRSCAR